MKTAWNFLKDVLKGVVIGLANIIPGVSGGTMMVAMGIYDKLIHVLSHLLSDLKRNILFLIPILIGMLIAIAGGSVAITYLFEQFPLPTTLAFIGLILGGLPMMVKNVKGNKPNPGQIIGFLFFFALVIVMALMGENKGNEASFTLNLVNVILAFIVGIVAAGTMVIPGVSGSMVLLLLGYYNMIVGNVSGLLAALKAGDFQAMFQACSMLFPFGVGVLVGIVGFAKLIEYIFKKYPLYAYWCIIGLIVASPFAILLMNSFGTITVLQIICGAICLAAGFFVALKLGE